jgi:hypothetical protein
MASQAVALVALFSLSVAPDRPPRNAPLPDGPQPEFATVQAIDPAQKRIDCLQTEEVMSVKLVNDPAIGKAAFKMDFHQEFRINKRVIVLGKDTAFDATGKKVSTQDALKRLKVGDTVLLAPQRIDLLYLGVIRPGTLLLVSPTALVPLPDSAAMKAPSKGEPDGPRPRFANVHRIDKDSGKVRLVENRISTRYEMEKIIVNGRQTFRRVGRTALRPEEFQFSVDKGTIMDTAGKKVPTADVWKRLTVGATILIASRQPDAIYMRIVQPETLIFINSTLPPAATLILPPKM